MTQTQQALSVAEEEFILSLPPFVTVEGVVNIREVGGLSAHPHGILKPGLIFRSGELSRIFKAGKDRTGLFIALLLMLLGVDDEAIIHDYSLTTAGLEPMIPLLTERFQKIATFRDNWQGTLNMGSSRRETMQAVLHMIRSRFGGPEGYLRSYTGLGDKDIDVLRKNLTVPHNTKM